MLLSASTSPNMNQQILSVLFCALICSTLGHEYARAHELTYRARHQERSHSSVARFRDNNDNCTYICPVPKPSGEDSGIRLIILKEVSLVAVLNVTAHVALAVDIQANLVVLFNGNSGATILIDLKEEIGVSWSKGSNDKLWIASEISFVKYLLALGSLTKVKDFPNGQQFKIKSASNEIVTLIGGIISQLGSTIASRVKINAHAAISIVLVISKVLVATLGGSLSILMKKVESTEIVLQAGLAEVANLLKGLAAFSEKITGGLKDLLIADVNFKLSLVLAASSSLEAIVALLSQFAHKVDLSKVLGPILQTPEALLEAIVYLGKGRYEGIFGIETVVLHVLLLISKKISITEFIDIIIQLAADGSAVSKEKFTDVVEQVILLIQIQVSTFKSSEYWQGLLTFFNNLKAGNLTVGGIDISAIVNVIIENGGKTSLNLVVSILLKLSAVVGLSVAVATLYLRLLFFIVSGQGVVYILKLLPNINFNIDFSSNKSIISQILSGIRLSDILRYILSFNIIGVITNLPVLGDIFKSVNAALEAAGKKSDELITGLKGSGIASVLFGWIRYALGIDGGSAPSGGIAGQLFIGGGASIDISISQILVSSSGSTVSPVGLSSSASSISASNSSSSLGINGSSSADGAGSWVGGIHFKHHEGHKKHEESRRKHGNKAHVGKSERN